MTQELTTLSQTPCKFTFDDEKVWDGFDHGSKWNGFDNVAVTKETLDAIIAHFEAIGDDTESLTDLRQTSDAGTMDNGLYSLGWGYATQIVRDDEMADEDKRQIAEQFAGPLASNNPHVLYISDGEQTTFMPLRDLISNFNANGGWHDRCNAEDMRDEVFGRGWYEGTHDFGRYIVVDVAKIRDASNLSRYFKQ